MSLSGPADTIATQAALVQALLQAASAAGTNPRVAMIETHISFVLLTGHFAYKIKKAVGLSFLDFRTLAARHFYCNEELRLNRRFAPEIYLDVVTITGTVDAPVIGGDGPAIEYAVKMREFAQEALASEVLARGELTTADIDALAASIAAAHQIAAIAPAGSRFGAPQLVLDIASHNFSEIRPLLDRTAEQAETDDLDRLEQWTAQAHARARIAMELRHDHGRIRECHGDLHLGNIALIGRTLTLFDCIEFNEEMRWIDVMSEVAFTIMDLRDRGRPDLAHRLQNAYLETTGDYDGLHVLRFYLVYRAMVRAKVARLRAAQLADVEAKLHALGQFRSYLRLAGHYAEAQRPALIITHGLSGSGKSTMAQALLEHTGAIRIRTDVERTRGSDKPGPPGDPTSIDSGRYAPEATRATYVKVLALARSACECGYQVIADATFQKRWQREAFRSLAKELGVPLVIVSCTASDATMRARIVKRMAHGNDDSQADLEVLEHQLRTQEPLGSDEHRDVVACDTDVIRDEHQRARWCGLVDRFVARTDGPIVA